ncbi:hypothetical protein H8B13_01735 [Hymenobacter sp. BT188]|uniref:DUF6624 domain-containing protein n=1 Tax=Hymenobacter sp. BT188 TaxID=2763504 RepID=UPI0016515CD1|nr:DUF6624 domain-containing protein [Hymenobacter sp. BT188]MBC6605531.1 hypothetical protein [Hymenobacter sp. BT188]
MTPRFYPLILGALMLVGCNNPSTASDPLQSQIGSSGAADSAASRTYRLRLTQLGTADQQDRQEFIAVLRQYGLGSAQFAAARRHMGHKDSLRLRQFLVLEKRYGWPHKSQVGAEAIVYAYLLVQHAPKQVQLSYRHKIQTSYERGELPGADYATYLDRMLGYEGKPQRYGTQYDIRVLANGREESYLLPIEDLSQVDERRETVQLEPLLPQLVPGTLVFKPGMK